MVDDIGSSFTDSVIAVLSKDEEVISSCAKEPIWDADRRVLLLHIQPKSKEIAKELADKVVQMIRSIRGFIFKAEIQESEIEGIPNYFFKLTVQK
jgi:hypothetical protein